ncbi:hypothetical protein PAXRUDRAFT_14247 [Paxillus rubicundulus Ve08.2h10]|uniref:Uncharacterized protein n=1 Tax=Paxillus rubicundulus Ve08.2h10 TaxID=930991 RepID=A0A0D0D287_9AGAM|nr:hypothetical protein PAXRUDRAFT_14247 [Paxillus rubicundulus Ve08.2h10]
MDWPIYLVTPPSVLVHVTALHGFHTPTRPCANITHPTLVTHNWLHAINNFPPLQWFHTTLTSHSALALQAKDQLHSVLATLNAASNHSSPSFNPSSSSNPSSSHRRQNNLPKRPAPLSPEQPDHSHKCSRSFCALDKPIPTDETEP